MAAQGIKTNITRNAPAVYSANDLSLSKVKSIHLPLELHDLGGRRAVIRQQEAVRRIPMNSAVYRTAPQKPTCSMTLLTKSGNMTPPITGQVSPARWSLVYIPKLLPPVTIPRARPRRFTNHCPAQTIDTVKTPPAPMPKPRPCASIIWQYFVLRLVMHNAKTQRTLQGIRIGRGPQVSTIRPNIGPGSHIKHN